MVCEMSEEQSQAGELAAVKSIRTLHLGWRQNARRYGTADKVFKIMSLIASACVAAFSGPAMLPHWLVASLGLVAIAGTGIPETLATARKADNYWRAWKLLNIAILRFDGGQLNYPRLVAAYEKAETFLPDRSMRGASRTPNSGRANERSSTKAS
jgi:hypothetical protein